MVTKGYQKGVYDRVTEGTWELARIGKSSRQSSVVSLQSSVLSRQSSVVSTNLWLDAAGGNGNGCELDSARRRESDSRCAS
jgi:hypothetical protein